MPGITISTDRTGKKLYPFWTVMNCNYPAGFLNDDFIKRQKTEKPFITQVNAVYLLGGRRPGLNAWYEGMNPDGSIKADFSGMIAQLQSMLDNGYKPWPVLDNVPYEMSDPPTENNFGNTAPPADENIWEAYVEAALHAMVDAFGHNEVDTWWFRVGTEPDYIPGHWSGTKEQFLNHYEHTVAAFERVIPAAKIGPGNVINPVDGEYGVETFHQWGLDFFDHCAEHDIRMDWFSMSWYGRVGISLDYFDEAVRMIHERRDRFKRFRNIPVLIGEFSVLHDEHDNRLYINDGTEWNASFYAAVARRVYDYDIRQVYEWGHAPHGVLLPHGRVIRMLNEMAGGIRLLPELTDRTDLDTGVIACRKGADLYLLLYNHHAHRNPKVPEAFTVTLQGNTFTPNAKWLLTEQLLDHEHGVWSYAFNADCATAGIEPLPGTGPYEGKPRDHYGKTGDSLFLENIEKYRELSQPLTVDENKPVTCKDNTLTLERIMDGNSVRFIKLSYAT